MVSSPLQPLQAWGCMKRRFESSCLTHLRGMSFNGGMLVYLSSILSLVVQTVSATSLVIKLARNTDSLSRLYLAAEKKFMEAVHRNIGGPWSTSRWGLLVGSKRCSISSTMCRDPRVSGSSERGFPVILPTATRSSHGEFTTVHDDDASDADDGGLSSTREVEVSISEGRGDRRRSCGWAVLKARLGMIP